MNLISTFIDQQGFALLDGGLATELESRGADLDHALWSARLLSEDPALVQAAHLAYLEAGADIIATASYQASVGGFRATGVSTRQAEKLIRSSTVLAVAARDTFWEKCSDNSSRQRPLVAISIGPYGACLHDGSEYHGNYGVGHKELMDFHRPRMELLADGGADLFAFETIPSQLEAEVLVELMQEFPDHCAWLSFSCKNGNQVSHGELLADCAALADENEQIIAVGVNCTPPQFISELLENTQDVLTPRVVYPNSGEAWQAAGNQWVGNGCQPLSVTNWFDRGARLIGGCCRTTPADISHMREELTEHTKSMAIRNV